MNELLLTVNEARRLLSVGNTKFYDLIADGHITVVRLGRRVLIPMASLKAFAASLPGKDEPLRAKREYSRKSPPTRLPPDPNLTPRAPIAAAD